MGMCGDKWFKKNFIVMRVTGGMGGGGGGVKIVCSKDYLGCYKLLPCMHASSELKSRSFPV